MKCIICGSRANKLVFREHEIKILKCTICGHVYSGYRQNQDYEDYFSEYQTEDELHWWREAHETIYEVFYKRYMSGKKGRLLDVGCGLGFFLKKLSYDTEWVLYGYEISKPAVKFAKEKLGLKNIQHGKVEESGFPDNYFDIITLWDVIEHIPDPNNLLLYLYRKLKRNGSLFIHTPNIKVQLPKARIKKLLYGMRKNKHYLEAKDHINIYSPESIRNILEKNNFKKINFTHLPPIQSVSGSKSLSLKMFKNIWYYMSVCVYYLTLKSVNMDNLFVVARRKQASIKK